MKSRRALTLIELMIAMALGLVILSIAFAAVRSMQQAYRIATSERDVNVLLVSGYHLGIAEIDDWRAHDAPESAMGQSLRVDGQPFQRITLPAAARFMVPSDPRWWDRSGPRAYNQRKDGSIRTFQVWPDHSQVCGIGFTNPQAAFLHQQQATVQSKGGTALTAAVWPGHLPLGTFLNTTGVPSISPTAFAVGWFESLVDPGTPPIDHKDEDESVEFPMTSRFGRAQNGKRWWLAPRLGWGSRSNVSAATVTDLATAARLPLRYRDNWLVAARNQELVDPQVIYAGSPGFATAAVGRHTCRLDIRRSVTAMGESSVVVVVVSDNDSGRSLEVPFVTVGTTLFGARMARGLEQ